MWWTELSTEEDKMIKEERESWVYDSGPLKTDENYAQIETDLLEYHVEGKLNWGACETEDQDITYEPENKILAEFTGDKHFILYNDGETLRHKWDFQYAWDDSDCVSSSKKGKGLPEALEAGDTLNGGELPDIEYFRDKIARATTSDQQFEIEKQIELLEFIKSIDHQKTFDDAMKIIGEIKDVDNQQAELEYFDCEYFHCPKVEGKGSKVENLPGNPNVAPLGITEDESVEESHVGESAIELVAKAYVNHKFDDAMKVID